MSNKKLKEVRINNKSYGSLDGYKIYLTEDFYEHLSSEKLKDGTLLIDRLKRGELFKGLKHLITSIIEKNGARLVFTLGFTEKIKNDYYICYKEYKKCVQEKFYIFYRETGLDVASKYLNKNFPGEFELPEDPVLTQTYKTIDKNFSQILHDFSEEETHQKTLIRETAKILESLCQEKKLLMQDIGALMELQKQSSIFYYTQKIEELKKRLFGEKQYQEVSGNNSWQNWIYENNWLFGVNYQKPIQNEKVGFENIPDFLFPSLDGFLDILEIKLSTAEVICEDKSHPGSYSWSSEVNKAIGQVINYIYQIELNQLQLKDRINQNYNDIYSTSIFVIKPRAIILIGLADGWKNYERQAYRKLNYALHGIEVLTYTDLVQKRKKNY